MQVVMAEEEEVQANKAKEAAKKWLGKKLILKGRDSQVIIDNEEILNLFGLSGTTVNETGFEALIEKITPKIETQARDAVFVFKDDRVNEFQPEIVGSKIDIPLFKQVLGETLYNPEKGELEVSLILTYPDITTGDINDLGIKELIGRGSSEFAHSIPGRVFNVNLASTRISGVLVPPGEEFSFNAVVGEISRETGYQSAYIISGGRTVLGDGGGVCQVSTTVFRAALNAGLPITERKAHAYRVGYYEQDSKPGIDATVYNPTADLKFKNDTEHHILVQTYVDTKTMKMRVDIFGTKDGRVAKISEPRVSGQTPPPATMYVDDPTLVKGTKKQIDWSAWGAKVSFDYTVEKGGQMVYEKTFYSNYQPWQAVYLVGMKE
ncbi:MAG: VanW family protein [Candidatus Collierbacteria bacterium GW2011_GWF1_44_12]|uniref:VanW family protein n=3 Tax=Candidatus Collieribacteriota TaxID=1752725 RepID=A0A0G1J4E0_9BACT|nr:MAG: VanW family protein [Candidatus Collierbacteria bacterium GW2011_GWF1_44_12]